MICVVECNKKHSSVPETGMPMWHSSKSTDSGARLAWIHLDSAPSSVTSGMSFTISDSASVKCTVALRN